jgi:hypothetical protein
MTSVDSRLNLIKEDYEGGHLPARRIELAEGRHSENARPEVGRLTIDERSGRG